MKRRQFVSLILFCALMVTTVFLLTSCKKKYIATFDADGGEVSITEKKVTFEENFELPVPTKLGHTFLGWMIDDEILTDKNGKSLSAWNFEEDKTFKAMWEVSDYKVTLNTNGGKCEALDTYTYGVGAKLPIPKRGNYKFEGWYDNSEFNGNVIAEIKTTETGDKTYFAKWTGDKFTVKFDTDGGSKIDDMVIALGDDYSITQIPQNEPYTFGGWYTHIGGGGRKIENTGKWSVNYNVTLYPYWIGSECVKYQESADGYIAYNKDESNPEQLAIQPYYNGQKVVKVGDKAFRDCEALQSVFIPDTVETLGESCFELCTSLKNLHLGSGLKLIGRTAFYFCNSLVDVKIPEGVTGIDVDAFRKCTSLENISIPDSIEFIWGAFTNCDKIKYNTYGNANYLGNDKNPCVALISVKDNSITEFTLPDSTKLIYYYAFFRCSSLKTLNLNEGLKNIESNAFGDCISLEHINIPESVTAIGGGAFGGCTSLEYINIPETVTKIGIYAFGGCSSLREIKIPGNIDVIGSGLFNNCTSLESIVLPKTIKEICAGAFEECLKLQTVYYEGTEESWDSVYVVLTQNRKFADAKRYYYSETAPTTTGDFWHYVDSKPTAWEPIK